MERCKLTQVPCREAIMEVVQNNKNRRSLQHTYELAELFQVLVPAMKHLWNCQRRSRNVSG